MIYVQLVEKWQRNCFIFVCSKNVLCSSLSGIALSLRRCFVLTWAAQIGNMQTELKKLAELNPELKDAYLAKQRRLKVS